MPLVEIRGQLTLWEKFRGRYSSPKTIADISSLNRRLIVLLVKMAKHLLRDAVILEIGCGGSVCLPLATLRLAIKANTDVLNKVTNEIPYATLAA